MNANGLYSSDNIKPINIIKSGLLMNLNLSNISNDLIIDTTGNGRDGKLFNGAKPDNSYGGGIFFDGVNDFCDIANTSEFGKTDFTINCLYKSTDANPSYFFSKQFDGLYGSFWIENNGFGVGTTTSYYYAGRYGGVPNKWYYMTGTYSNNTMKCYVNGKLKATTTTLGTYRVNSNNINLGRYGTIGLNNTATITHASYYNRCLAEEEVMINFNSIRKTVGL